MKVIEVNHCTTCPFAVVHSNFYSSTKEIYCCLTPIQKTLVASGEPPFKFDIPKWCPIDDGVKIVKRRK